MKEDNITQKLILAVAVIAAVSFAVWTGFATSVEASQPAPQASGFTTPF